MGRASTASGRNQSPDWAPSTLGKSLERSPTAQRTGALITAEYLLHQKSLRKLVIELPQENPVTTLPPGKLLKKQSNLQTINL